MPRGLLRISSIPLIEREKTEQGPPYENQIHSYSKSICENPSWRYIGKISMILIKGVVGH